ncbi:hypothetical protein SDC9_120035 [bioreactor metagenome]|uniref:Uncharacterized protein n=1 Tax=bioreactor metagenome TaxID=1076179 RepID=A0A645C5Z6_9ZZZZ
MLAKKREYGEASTPAMAKPDAMAASSAAIQLEMMAMPATGAAVESTRKASFSRETPTPSVMELA